MPMAIRSLRKRGRTPVAWKWPITVPSGAVPVRTNLKISCIWMMSPSSPVISAIEVTLRLPSDRRESCTISLMADGDLAADRGDGHRHAGHADELLEARDRLARIVGVDGRHRAFVAGVHGLQHVEGFLAAALAEDDALGPHTQRVLDQLALADFALAFEIGRPRLHARDVRLLQLQLGGVLDGDQALLLRDEGGQRVEHRGLAGAGAAGDDRGDARLHRGRQHLGHLRPDRVVFDQLVQVERLLGELADRDQRPVDADRPHRDVDARAVEQARVAQRMRFIDAAADRGDDLVDDAQQMLLVLEAHAAGLEQAAALHIDAFVAVDQDIGDGRVLEQRLERPEAGHLVEDFGDEVVELLLVEREPLDQDVLRDQLLDVRAHLVFRQLLQRREIDLLDQPAMQAHLGVEQLVGQQRIGRLQRPGSGAPAPETRVQDTPSSAGDGSSAATGSGAAARRAVKRPTILVPRSVVFESRVTARLARPGQLELLQLPALGGAGLAAGCGSISFLSCSVILLPGLTSSSGTPRSIASRTRP